MILPPFPGHGDVQWSIFVPSQDTNNVRGWQTWMQPPGSQWIYLIAVGAGGGGAGGQSTAAAARAGGGGGGAAGITRVLMPAFVIPDLLYVRPAPGGAGGAAAGNGTSGNTVSTFVSMAPDAGFNANHVAVATGGTGGTATGTAGSAGTGNATKGMGAWGLDTFDAGQAGGAGGANTGAVGTNIAPPSLFITGGAGGAGSGTGNNVFAGGDISSASPATGIATWRTLSGGAAGVSGTTAGGNGQAGINCGRDISQMMSRGMPLLFSGGSGGGSGGASNGGAGGPGAWGCGGGGGGAGAVGGVGGRGGDGFVIIGAF
jgi:hypothetical protein